MVVVSGPGYHITRGGSAEVWQTRFSYGRDALVVLFCLQFDRRGGLIGTSWGVCKDLAAQIIVWGVGVVVVIRKSTVGMYGTWAEAQGSRKNKSSSFYLQ